MVSLRRARIVLAAAASAAALTGCLAGPGFFRQSNVGAINTKVPDLTAAEVTNDEGGVVTALINPNSTSAQVVNASANSAIARASILVPPGAVGVETAFTIEEGQSLATSTEAGTLGVGGVESAAAAVVVTSSVDLSPTTPMTLSLPIPDGAGLLLTQGAKRERIVVLFKVKRPDSEGGGYFFGLLPIVDLALEDGLVRVQITRFGSYQAIVTKELVTEKKEIQASSPVVTAREEKAKTSPAPSPTPDKPADTPKDLLVEASTSVRSARERLLSAKIDNAVGTVKIAWSQAGGPTARIVSPAEATTAVFLTTSGDYKFIVRVEDGAGRSKEHPVAITFGAMRKTFGFDAAGDYDFGIGTMISGGIARSATPKTVDAGPDFVKRPMQGGTQGNGPLRIDPAAFQARSLDAAWFGPLTGLALHADFEQDVGNAQFAVRNNVPGAPDGVFQPQPIPASPKTVLGNARVGKAILFDPGEFDRVAFTNVAPLQSTQPFTVMAWIKPTSSSPINTLFARFAGSDGYIFSYFFDGPETVIKFEIGDGTNEAYVEGRIVDLLNYDRWTHVAVTYDPTRASEKLRLHVDGRLRTGTTHGDSGFSTITYTTDLWLGSLGGIDGFKGEMDEAIIFNGRALSNDELKNLFEHQRPDHTAYFVSQPFDSGATGYTWSSFQWQAKAPYGLQIPMHSVTEGGYAEGALDTTSLQLLLRFDEAEGSTPIDASGRGHVPTLDVTAGTDDPLVFPGVVGNAWSFGDGTKTVAVPNAANLNFGYTDDFTVAGWVRLRAVGGNDIIFQKISGLAGFKGYQGSTGLKFYLQAPSSEYHFVSSVPPPLDRWIHVAFVYEYVSSTVAHTRIYIDGILSNSGSTQFNPTAPGSNLTNMANSGAFLFGGDGSNSSSTFEGQMDEFGVFNTAMSQPTIESLFRRGALRTEFRVRACAVVTCADNPPFVTAATSPSPISLSGRFLQYQTRLSSLTAGASTPEIASVSAGPAPLIPGLVAMRQSINYGAITGFSEAGNAGARYQASFDDGTTWNWFNGSAWVPGGVAGSNDPAAFGAALMSLTGGSLKVRVVLMPTIMVGVIADAALDEFTIDYVAP